MAFHNSVQPVFLEDIVAAHSSDWGYYYQVDVPNEDTHVTFLHQDINPGLLASWYSWKQLSQTANGSYAASFPLLLHTLAETGYRLLALRFHPESLDEMVRLGLLAFSCSVFLKWDHVKIRYPQLISAFKNCVLDVILPGHADVSATTIVWILMAGQLCICTGADWLRHSMRIYIDRAGIRSWEELRSILKAFIWIDSLHDQPARDLYNSILCSSSSSC